MVMSTLARLAGAFTFGPYAVEETIERIQRELEDPAFPARGVWTAFLAELEASRGRVERARELSRAARTHAAEAGNVIAGIVISGSAFEVERMGGDLEAAEAIVRESVDRLEEMGHGWAESWRAVLARVVLEQGRVDEAEELLDRRMTRIRKICRSAHSCSRGVASTKRPEAARKAAAVYESTDATPFQAELARLLAEVLRLGERRTKPAPSSSERWRSKRHGALRSRRQSGRAPSSPTSAQPDPGYDRLGAELRADRARLRRAGDHRARSTSVRSVALGFWIGAGSRDETDAKAGVSHFIEHLLFKGTRDYTAQEIAEIFDGLGGELNAATSREHTVVYARVPDRHLEKALDVMARHGLRAGLRRARRRARGRARGDRDGTRTRRRSSSTTCSPRPSSATIRSAGP